MRVNELLLHYAGSRGGRRQMTWGQQSQWDMLARKDASEHHVFHDYYDIDLPEDVGLHLIMSALSTLLSRFETLKTSFHFDGTHWQTLAEVGTLPIPLIDAHPEEMQSARRHIDSRLDKPFGEDEISLRCAILRVASKRTTLYLSINHVAIDGMSADVFIRALHELLGLREQRACAEDAEGMQPFELADLEVTALAQQRSARARTYWRRQLMQMPNTVLSCEMEGPTPEEQGQEIGDVSLSSGHLLDAATSIARREYVGVGVVVLSAVGATLSAITECPRVGFQLFAANRHDRRLRNSVACLVQPVPTVLDCADGSFLDLVRRTGQSVLAAYRHGWYDPRLVGEELAAVRADRGLYINAESCVFSDRTISLSSRKLYDDHDEVRSGYITWAGTCRRKTAAPLAMSVRRTRDGMLLRALADLAYLPRDKVRDVLLSIEDMCVKAADGDFDLASAKSMVGIAPVPRGERWLYVDGSYICLEQSWSLLEGCDEIGKFVAYATGDDQDRHLVLHALPGHPRITAELVREALLNKLREFPFACVPRNLILHHEKLPTRQELRAAAPRLESITFIDSPGEHT